MGILIMDRRHLRGPYKGYALPDSQETVPERSQSFYEEQPQEARADRQVNAQDNLIQQEIADQSDHDDYDQPRQESVSDSGESEQGSSNYSQAEEDAVGGNNAEVGIRLEAQRSPQPHYNFARLLPQPGQESDLDSDQSEHSLAADAEVEADAEVGIRLEAQRSPQPHYNFARLPPQPGQDTGLDSGQSDHSLGADAEVEVDAEVVGMRLEAQRSPQPEHDVGRMEPQPRPESESESDSEERDQDTPSEAEASQDATADEYYEPGDNDEVPINLEPAHNANDVAEDQAVEGPAPIPLPETTHKLLRRAINTDKFISPISTPVNTCPAEALLMVLATALENNWTFKAFVDTVHLLNSLFVTPVIPNSAYLLDQLLHSDSGIIRFFFCAKCFHAFGNLDHTTIAVIVCPEPECKFSNNIKDLTKATYFVLYPITPQIQLLFSNPEVYGTLRDPKVLIQSSDANVWRDLYDGTCYKKFVSSLQDGDEKIISFVFCTDGSPLFKSSNYSIWPIFLSINELPPVTRMRNLLIGGLWFGNNKPPMDLFLQPFAEHMKSLSNGFAIKINGVEIKFLVYVLGCCVDSGARGAVQGINSHSGYYSCSWCEIPGEYCCKKVVFPFEENPSKIRTHDDVVRQAVECVEDGHLQYVCGVQYLSPIAHMPKFDIVNGIVQDFAHNVPFGISRTFLTKWLTDTSRGFYIGAPDDITELDKKMLQLTPPIEVRRPVRKISESSHWNAREYENWTLFYSLIVLKHVLPLKFLTHWSYLVQAIYLLSRQTVNSNDINNAHKLLLHYVSEVEFIYGKSYMRYNVHILIHLAENTVRWGPIWAVSTYCFESGIKYMKGLLHAQRGVPHQIHRALCYMQARAILRSECRTPKTEAFEASLQAKPCKMLRYLPLEECVVLGKGIDFQSNEEESFLINRMENVIDASLCLEYHKIILGKCVYTTTTLASGKRFNNSCAVTKSNEIIIIKKFVRNRADDKVYLFCNDVTCDTCLKMPAGIIIAPQDHCLRVLSTIGRRLRLLSVQELMIVCVKTEMDGQIFITPFPNLFNVF